MSWPRQTAQPGIVSCLEDHHVRFLMLDSNQLSGNFATMKSSKKQGGRMGAHSEFSLPLPLLQPGLACVACMSPLPLPGIHVDQ